MTPSAEWPTGFSFGPNEARSLEPTMRMFRGVIAVLLLFAIGCSKPAQAPPRSSGELAERVVLINVSGLPPGLFNSLYQIGRLKNIRKLQSRSMEGWMAGGVPPAFAGVTTSMFTGMNAETQGVDNWFFEGESKKRLYGFESGHVKVPTIQQALAAKGNPCLTVFWPVTHPAPANGGRVVSPGPIQPKSKIGDFAFLPSLEPELTDRCNPPELCRKLKPIFENQLGDQEILDLLNLGKESPGLSDEAITDLMRAYKADATAMEILFTLWRPEGKFISVNLAGASVVARRFFGPWTGDESRNNPFDRMVLTAYLDWLDQFVGRVVAFAGPDAVVILASDHGMGAARDADPFSDTYPGRPHPLGVCFIAGPPIDSARSGMVLKPQQIAPLVLYLLGLPIADDFSGKLPDKAIRSDYYTVRPPKRLPSYGKVTGRSEPASRFGRFIKPKDRYLRWDELPPPRAR
jgi:Type I phosphodiesterase / nucleotide pyrophosphatase